MEITGAYLMPKHNLFKFIVLTKCLSSFIGEIALYLHSNNILVFCGACASCMYKKELGQTPMNPYRREFGPHHTNNRRELETLVFRSSVFVHHCNLCSVLSSHHHNQQNSKGQGAKHRPLYIAKKHYVPWCILSLHWVAIGNPLTLVHLEVPLSLTMLHFDYKLCDLEQ